MKNYLDTYAKVSYEKLSLHLADSIRIIDGEYSKSYSHAEFHDYYQWDSVFSPQFHIEKISSKENNVFITLSTKSDRFKFLVNNPVRTTQCISLIDNKIYQFKYLQNHDTDREKWIENRDSLVNWIDNNHPELSGFIYDMTKLGSENYLKAIGLYNNRQE
ncbi:hypothetical protein EYV94_13620 [Puteibacter caeruleilacunae]|nr:hypothetical protein EYV94_13620 [Puteibacter caeruleilacunae]